MATAIFDIRYSTQSVSCVRYDLLIESYCSHRCVLCILYLKQLQLAVGTDTGPIVM